MNDMRPLAHTIISILFVVTYITIPMRIWVRGVSMKSFGWDDWVMTSMLILFPGQEALLTFFLMKGAGLHLDQVVAEDPGNVTHLLKGLLAEEFYYVTLQFLVKMCFLLFFFRLSQTRAFVWSLWAVIALNSLGTIAILLFYGLQCLPLEAFYYPERHPDVKCINAKITYFFPFTLIFLVDVCILILPIPTIMSLQMTLKRKVAVISVITTGGSAVLAGGLRAIILMEFARSPDFSWSLGKMVMMSAVEIDLGILAANMPALKAFYKCWREGKLGAGQGQSLAYGDSTKDSRGTRSGGVELSSGVSRPKPGPSVNTGVMERLPSTESEEKLWDLPKQKPKKAEYESSWRSAEASS
ncbi:unnamed protein product [Clonostachys rosea f. rosea IK726]|uniref:Rhodopsin domain-containing protein n=2 Tax=Bionectria ochroleuca TaxID=29856 RepID=A0A8H7NPX9_BIOOC|nr:unnamed protein product [Clonostachys rosea f. rosea IK726]